MPLEAPTLPCSSCGSALAVDPAEASGRCSHCGTVTQVPAALRERARAYHRAIAGERRRVSFAERFSRGIQEGDALSRASGKLITAILVLAGMLTAGQMAPSFTRLGGVVRVWSGIGFAVGLLLCLVWFFWRVARWGDEAAAEAGAATREPSETMAPLTVVAGTRPTLPQGAGLGVLTEGTVQGTCSACGGPATFSVGQASAKCPYCGATVMATAADQERLLAIAGKHADLMQARAERAFHRKSAGFQNHMGHLSSILRVGLGMAMPCVLLVIIGVSFVSTAPAPVATRGRGRRASTEMPVIAQAGLGLIGLGTGAALIGAVALGVSRYSRPRAIGRALAALAERSPGPMKTAEGSLPVLDWLDANWADSAPDEVLTLPNRHDGKPGRRWSLGLSHRGRAALVVVTHDPVRRVDVFLSDYRRRAEAAKAPGKDEAARAGFELSVSRGGVHLVHGDSDPGVLAAARVDRLLEIAATAAQG